MSSGLSSRPSGSMDQRFTGPTLPHCSAWAVSGSPSSSGISRPGRYYPRTIREILILSYACMDTDMEHHPVNTEHPVAPSHNGSGHETREVDVRFIVISLIVLLIGAFLVCLLTIGIFRFF